MRIGIDARLWNETGVGRYIRNLVFQLQELDTKNEYVLFVRSNDSKNNSFNFAQEKSSKWKIVKTDIYWHSVAEQMQFPQVLYKEKLDLMHFPYFSLPIFYHRPFVVTIHDLIINHFPTGKASTLPYPLYLAKRIGYDLVTKHAVRKAQKIIVPLTVVKDDMMKMLGVPDKKIVVTYEGVEISSKDGIATSSSTPRNDAYFLYVGNAYPHKNLEILIDAFVAFKKENKNDIQLLLVGKDDFFYKRLHEKVAQERLTGIVFRHDVSDEALFALYAHAIAFVSASKMEGFGLPPLEAMTSSCPVLLADIPSFNEVCRDAAVYFDPYSKESLKEKLHFVYNLDHKQKQEYLRKGLERIKDFSWEKMAKETLVVYESCTRIRQN